MGLSSTLHQVQLLQQGNPFAALSRLGNIGEEVAKSTVRSQHSTFLGVVFVCRSSELHVLFLHTLCPHIRPNKECVPDCMTSLCTTYVHPEALLEGASALRHFIHPWWRHLPPQVQAPQGEVR